MFVARYLTRFSSSVFFCDDQLHVSLLGDEKFLHPDVVGVVINIARNRVDSLSQRINAEFFASVRNLPIAPKWEDPVLATGFDLIRKARISSEPRVVEMGVR